MRTLKINYYIVAENLTHIQQVDKLKEKERTLDSLGQSVQDMVAKIRATVGKIRTQIKSMEVGVEFEGEGDEGEESEGRSNLELKNPENLEELAVMTEVDMYFNVTDNESDDRAFLMYIGNEVGWILHSLDQHWSHQHLSTGGNPHDDAAHLDRRLLGSRARRGWPVKGELSINSLNCYVNDNTHIEHIHIYQIGTY